jgi:hypothetical protein
MSDAMMSETVFLSRINDSKITKQHWEVMFISGMGFFTNAYDLFIRPWPGLQVRRRRFKIGRRSSGE